MAAQITVTKWIWSFTGAFAHAAAGYIAVTKAHQYGGHKWQLIVTGIALAAAAFKEFYVDANFESPATRGSDLLDFSFYALGIGLGWLI